MRIHGLQVLKHNIYRQRVGFHCLRSCCPRGHSNEMPPVCTFAYPVTSFSFLVFLPNIRLASIKHLLLIRMSFHQFINKFRDGVIILETFPEKYSLGNFLLFAHEVSFPTWRGGNVSLFRLQTLLPCMLLTNIYSSGLFEAPSIWKLSCSNWRNLGLLLPVLLQTFLA